MPKDEIAEALQELRAEIVKATGELPRNVERMILEELGWIKATKLEHPECPRGQEYAIVFCEEDCRKWWIEPARPVTPEQLATVRRSRLYFQALEKPKQENLNWYVAGMRSENGFSLMETWDQAENESSARIIFEQKNPSYTLEYIDHRERKWAYPKKKEAAIDEVAAFLESMQEAHEKTANSKLHFGPKRT